MGCVVLGGWLGLLGLGPMAEGRTVWVVAGRASPVRASSGVDGLEVEKSRAFLVAPQVGMGALAAGPDFGGHALLGGLLASSGGGCHCWTFGVGEGNTEGGLGFKSLDLCKETTDGRKGKPNGQV